METDGPYPLSLGQPVAIPGPADPHVTKLVLTNSSPFTCQVTSTAGPQQWLPAWTADLFAYPAGSATVVTPVASGPGTPSGPSVLATYLDPGDPVGSYPQTLTGLATAVDILGSVDIAGTVDISGPVAISGTVDITGPVTIPAANAGVPSTANPAFAIRDVSAYSQGHQKTTGAVTAATLIGSPPTGYTSTELHTCVVNNQSTSESSILVYTAVTELVLLDMTLAGLSSQDFDFKGLNIKDQGVLINTDGPWSINFTYTWLQ